MQPYSPLTGFTARPARTSDDALLAALWTRCDQDAGLSSTYDAATLHTLFTTPGFEAATSSQIVFDAAGNCVASASVWDFDEVPALIPLRVPIRRHLLRSALADSLITWSVERSKQALARCPEDIDVVLVIWARQGYAEREALLEKHGFTVTRTFYTMRIHMTEPPAVPPLPTGFTLRAWRYPEELLPFCATMQAAFQDHWGNTSISVEQVAEEFDHEIRTSPGFDHSLVYVVVDEATGTLAGTMVCKNETSYDTTVSHVDDVGVLRDYRGMGIATAMLRHAFAEFWRRGRPTVALNVDATNLTGALRLYERAGMAVYNVNRGWQYLLQKGTRSIINQ